MSNEELKDAVMDKLVKIADPEFRISIVDMGLIRHVDVDEENKLAKITIAPTNPACMSIAYIAMGAKLESEKVDGIDKAEVTVVDHFMADTVNELVNKEE